MLVVKLLRVPFSWCLPPAESALARPEGALAMGCDRPVVLQQQNFKQRVVALLRRFKVSEEVRAVRSPPRFAPAPFCQVSASPASRAPPHAHAVSAPRAVVPSPGTPQGPAETPGNLPCFLNITWMNTWGRCTSSGVGVSRGFCVFLINQCFKVVLGSQ